MKNKIFVAVLMGSDSDLEVLQTCMDTLQQLSIPYEANILSAHRTPTETADYVKTAQQRGCHVFIAAAGLAAHLAGFVAAHTLRPVIGIPLAAGSLNGMDSLLSTVQMPGGVPVATVSIGKAGAKNAALLAAQILALQDESLAKRLLDARLEQAEGLLKKNAALKNAG